MLIHNPASLANYLRDHRNNLQLTQSQVAESAAIRQDTVSQFELQPDNVRLHTLFRILSALELEVEIRPKVNSRIKKGTWDEQW